LNGLIGFSPLLMDIKPSARIAIIVRLAKITAAFSAP
jgi:hypothetical protein